MIIVNFIKKIRSKRKAEEAEKNREHADMRAKFPLEKEFYLFGSKVAVSGHDLRGSDFECSWIKRGVVVSWWGECKTLKTRFLDRSELAFLKESK